MSPTQAIHLPSPRQILNENYEQASSTNSLTYHNNGSGTSTIFTNTNNNHSTTQNSQYIVPKPALNRPHSPSPLSMESPMSESKYSFPNSTSTRDPKSMSFKPSSADQNMSSPSSEPFSTRSLAPLEPQHSAIPSYLTAQRRGSITDPSLHLSVPNPELARQYSQPDVNFPSTSSSGTISSERRGSFVTDQYPPSPPSHSSSVKSDHSFTPLETRKLRDSLPSISAGASPIRDGFPGPLINPAFQAQLQTRRHSIAVGEVAASLKQKGNIPAPNHPMASDDYPVKRRESVGDPNIQRLSLYDRRSSYSAPSSPPAPPSSSLVPSAKLNVQDVENSLQAHTESSTAPPYSDNGSDHQGTGSISTSHLSDQNDHAPVYPPFNNLRLSQIVQEEVSAPILARRASMPVMTFPSRYSDPAQQDGAVPMDVDRYRTQVYQNHHHTYHPYAYDYPNYIQPQTPVKETPYSRSPELRISHKLAERKRRKEMKELFDELRDSLPVDKSLKTSKWEILSKAVEFINNLKHNQDEMTKEVESLRQQLAAFKGCGNSSDISTAPTSS